MNISLTILSLEGSVCRHRWSIILFKLTVSRTPAKLVGSAMYFPPIMRRHRRSFFCVPCSIVTRITYCLSFIIDECSRMASDFNPPISASSCASLPLKSHLILFQLTLQSFPSGRFQSQRLPPGTTRYVGERSTPCLCRSFACLVAIPAGCCLRMGSRFLFVSVPPQVL